MRVTVLVGSDRLRVPVDEGSKTMSWLQAEIVRRWERSHPGEFLRISELRTADNVRLDNEDQVFEVCREDESLIAVLGTGTEKEVGPGDMVKQYYLMNLIGEGTFGRVYKAHDLNLNRYVAVKVLRREKANEINTRRFLREAELHGNLSNIPEILTVYDFSRTRGGTLFIVMELLKGRPLNELLDERIAKNEPFTVLECIQLMSPVLRGLHAAHRHNPSIVHRDLKPDNIFVRSLDKSHPPGHQTQIMDFGIAWHDEIAHETLACGTRMFSSPEQTRKNAKLDGRSDIWSCGVILYQMLSLLVDVPFDPVELLLSKGRVPDLSLHTRTALSPHMHAIVMRALEVDPNRRFQSADEMGDALHREEEALMEGIRASGAASAAAAAASGGAANTVAAVAATAVIPAVSGSASTSGPNTPTPPPSVTPTPTSVPPEHAPSTAAACPLSSPSASKLDPGSHLSSAHRALAAAAAAADRSQLHPRFQPGRRGGAFAMAESALRSKL